MFDNSAFYICISLSFMLSVIIAYLLMRNIHLRKLSERDEMTSMMNYRGICKQIEKLIKKKKPIALAIIDIDNFSVFNKNSYKLGDDVLKEFALFLDQSLPHDVLLARFRIGDEFIIVFQNVDIKKAMNEIEELKKKCENYHFISLKPFPLQKVTFSEGLAEITKEINSMNLLFADAEKRLREMKVKTNSHQPD